jgi:hypothetical protein
MPTVRGKLLCPSCMDHCRAAQPPTRAGTPAAIYETSTGDLPHPLTPTTGQHLPSEGVIDCGKRAYFPARNRNAGRLRDRAQPSTSGRRSGCPRTAQATFDYLLAPPPRMPIIAVRRCSSVPPIIVGAVCPVVVADPFREYVRTPLGFDHTPSPTGTVYSGLYRRSIMAPRSEPAVLMPIHMAAC